MMMKGCELCRRPARLHCEADGAWLCSHCDEKVHSANFLVGKHSRTLLCRVCQSPTPWTASGTRIGAAISVCHACCASNQGYSEEEGEVEEEGENQVVPWSPATPPPPTTTDSGGEIQSSSGLCSGGHSTNRKLRDRTGDDDEATSICCSARPAKINRRSLQ